MHRTYLISTRRIAVALSGGVDSSVAAYLLHKNAQPSDKVMGLFMNNWNPLDESTSISGKTMKTTYCEQSERDVKDAQSVCDKFSIKLHRASFASEYWIDVFEPFVDQVEKGRMFNPDVACNSKIKFGAMKQYAIDRLGATHVATGHYARLWHRDGLSISSSIPLDVEQGLELEDGCNDWIETWGKSKKSNEEANLFPLLLAGADLEKDQSYFLSGVSGDAFRNVLFPLGELSKRKTRKDGIYIQSKNEDLIENYTVRQIASEAKLPTANKRESMGICFIGKRQFPKFISEYMSQTPRSGKFICVDTQTEIGTHDGTGLLFTIGQGAKISGASQKWFVCDKDYVNGNIFVCPGTHHPALYSDELYVQIKDWRWVGMEAPSPLSEGQTIRASCRIRHLQPLIPCEVKWDIDNSRLIIHFDRAIRGVTSGQTATLYIANGVVCLGGGPIWDHGPTYHQQGKSLPLDLHPSGHNDLSVDSYSNYSSNEISI